MAVYVLFTFTKMPEKGNRFQITPDNIVNRVAIRFHKECIDAAKIG